tara:strand:+ start:123 stop:428 length:306 start_codon:yes stop_codon:yes gene_type:complete
MTRNLIKKSLNKRINIFLSLSLFLLLAILIGYNIKLSSKLRHLKVNKIPSINISIENLKNNILIENNKNDLLIRNSIRDKAEKFGMNKISDKNRINSDLYR